MEITHLWNKLDLQCKKVVSLALLSLLFFYGNAQKSQNINYAQYDEKKLSYGFILGGHYDSFVLSHTNDYQENTSVTNLKGDGGSGYTLGFIVNYHINDILDFRALPSVGFYERRIKYNNITDSEEVSELFESTFLELPLLFKFKSIRRGNTRFYFLAGVKPSIEVGANKEKVKETVLSTKSRDLSIELGIGNDSYFPYFKFSPELRFSLGLLNMIDGDNTSPSNFIKRMPSYSVGLYFIFE